MYTLIFTKRYTKIARKFIKSYPKLIGQYTKTLKLLEMNPRHPSLRLHKLKGNFEDIYSVSINIAYRITLELKISGNKIVLIDVGPHDYIYR